MEKTKHKVIIKKQNFFVKTFIIFKNSFKKLISKNTIYPVFLLLLFLSVFLLSSNMIGNTIKKKAESAFPSLTDINSLAAENSLKILPQLKGFIIYILAIIALYIAILIIAWALCEGTIWNLILNKKPSLKYYGKFLSLNIIWIIALILISLFSVLIFKKESAPYILIVLGIVFIYITPLMYILFAKENKIFQSIKITFSLGFKKIHHFIIPYIVIFLIFLILGFIYVLLNNFQEKLAAGIFIILLSVFITWVRYYLAEIVQNM